MSSHQAARIHPTALVSPGAVLGEGTEIGAYSIVGPHVVLGRGNIIGPHVVLEGHTTMGDENRIYQFASVGSDPQDLKYRGEPSELIIGHRNIIREYVTLQPGTRGGGMMTKIGNSNLFMANCHVGHDSLVGDNCILANSAGLSGHVTLGNGVVVGGLAGVHQFVRVGDVAMVGGGAMVVQDVPPYCISQGDRAALVGLNRIGLERNGASKEEVLEVRRSYRRLFTSGAPELRGKSLKERVVIIREESRGSRWLENFLSFIESSQRGIARPRVGKSGEDDTE